MQQQYLDLYKFLSQIKLQLLEATCYMHGHGVATLGVKGFSTCCSLMFSFSVSSVSSKFSWKFTENLFIHYATTTVVPRGF